MFKSETSKLQAQDNVNRLLLNYLPGSEEILSGSKIARKSSRVSGALIVNEKIMSKKNIHINEEIRKKLLKKERQSRRHNIQLQLAKNEQVSKIAKINKLKKEKRFDDEELHSIIESKVTKLKSWENSREDDFKLLQSEVLLLTNAQHDRRKKTKLKNLKKMDFNRKLRNGIVAYPGLTPGLAPVDLTDDDDSD